MQVARTNPKHRGSIQADLRQLLENPSLGRKAGSNHAHLSHEANVLAILISLIHVVLFLHEIDIGVQLLEDGLLHITECRVARHSHGQAALLYCMGHDHVHILLSGSCTTHAAGSLLPACCTAVGAESLFWCPLPLLLIFTGEAHDEAQDRLPQCVVHGRDDLVLFLLFDWLTAGDLEERHQGSLVCQVSGDTAYVRLPLRVGPGQQQSTRHAGVAAGNSLEERRLSNAVLLVGIGSSSQQPLDLVQVTHPRSHCQWRHCSLLLGRRKGCRRGRRAMVLGAQAAPIKWHLARFAIVSAPHSRLLLQVQITVKRLHATLSPVVQRQPPFRHGRLTLQWLSTGAMIFNGAAIRSCDRACAH
mmetsp:Transcript_30867/g.71697  ORF Transcript_30867/g.71697 Transcript_30867/m.71697 type:complete len:359 (+) Transcript_30867:228-1304(+)